MNQLTQVWARLTWNQRIWIAAAALAVIGGLTQLNRWNQDRDFKPLLSGLAPEDAGTVTAKLRELNVDYRLSDNGASILVPSEKVAETRLQLASAGLPKTGRIGFELFDKTNFGASEFAEQVNYHRAIEGELERSVMSIREVEQARVHITMAKDSLYTEQREPAKASVLVKLRSAAPLSPLNIAAICQLTASAVPGLSPDQVSVVDTNGNLLNRPRASLPGDGDDASEGTLEYRKSIEKDVQTKIAQTLEPLLGAEHFRAGVSAEVDLTSGDQSEELYNPDKSALATSQTSQDGPALPSASGVPGTASNLPNPTSKPSTGSTTYARHTENVTYQNSRVVRHTRLPQGTLKRLSLSVLVDHSLRWEGPKRIVEPPSAEKLKVIHDLVAAATGLNTDRGDQLVVEAFPFEATLASEPLTLAQPEVSALQSSLNLPPWLQKLVGQKHIAVVAGVGVAAVLALVIGFFVILSRSRKKRGITAETATAALEAAKAKGLASSPQELERKLHEQINEQNAEKSRQEAEALMKLKLPAVSTKKTEILIKHIGAEAKKDPTAMAQVVRSWLHENGPR
jgi:flagellar M-ring protein FliF